MKKVKNQKKLHTKISVYLTAGIIFLIIISALFVILRIKTTPTHISRADAGSSIYGFNVHSLSLLDSPQIQPALSSVDTCAENGGNTPVLRFWAFANENNLDRVISESPQNLKLIVTLSNYYHNYPPQPWTSPEDNPASWYGGGWKTNGFRDFVDRVTRKYSGNPKIFIWEIMNEPNCTGDSICTEAQHQFLSEISDLIAGNDPGKLISPGLQGQNTGGENFANGDYEKITSLPNITANSCHLYMEAPEARGNCLKALEITKKYNKFFYIGELGDSVGCTSEECVNTCSADTLEGRKSALQGIINEFASLGTGGFVIWQLSPERNPALICDGSSFFPGDPLCPRGLRLSETVESSPTPAPEHINPPTPAPTRSSIITIPSITYFLMPTSAPPAQTPVITPSPAQSAQSTPHPTSVQISQSPLVATPTSTPIITLTPSANPTPTPVPLIDIGKTIKNTQAAVKNIFSSVGRFLLYILP